MWKLTLGYYHGTSHSISIATKVLAGLHQLPKKPGYKMVRLLKSHEKSTTIYPPMIVV
jgi:hypothetical protein